MIAGLLISSLGSGGPLFDLNGLTLDVFGDSITYGINTTPGNNWPSLLASRFDMVLTNHAVSGTTIENQVPVDALASPNMESRISDIPVYVEGVSGLLGIAYLTNDVGLNYPAYNTTNYVNAINVVINAAVYTKGWPVNRIFFVGRYYINDSGFLDYGAPTPATVTGRYNPFNTAGQAACAARGVKWFDFYAMLSSVADPDSHLDAYERHPDDYMHGLCADEMIAYYS